VQVADLAAGALPAVIQILAALRQKDREGRGSIIDVSMTDNAYALLPMPMSRNSFANEPIGRGNDILNGKFACYDVYKTSDGGHMTVGALEPKFWTSLCRGLGRPDLIAKQYADGDDNTMVRDTLRQIFASKTTAEWTRIFAPLDACVEPVLAPENVSQTDRQLRARDVDITMQVGDETLRVPRTPLRMTGLRHTPERAPRIGEHTPLIEQLIAQRPLSTASASTSNTAAHTRRSRL